jgi:hypothetical protein
MTGGFCLQATSSTELYCSVPCGSSGTCPSATGEPGLAVGCATSQPTPVYPPVGQCVGQVMAGGTGFFGCWSVH